MKSKNDTELVKVTLKVTNGKKLTKKEKSFLDTEVEKIRKQKIPTTKNGLIDVSIDRLLFEVMVYTNLQALYIRTLQNCCN